MGLPWIRLENNLPQNPKILHLVDDKQYQAAFAYVCSLTFAGTTGTDGFIPRSALPFIHARLKDAQALVDVGLWVEGAGGWDIHDWKDYQLTSAEHAQRRDRAKKAAAKRWSTVEVTASGA
jgi:hypothetical protein